MVADGSQVTAVKLPHIPIVGNELVLTNPNLKTTVLRNVLTFHQEAGVRC